MSLGSVSSTIAMERAVRRWDALPAIRGVCGRSERCRGWFVLGLLNWFVVFRWIGSCVVIRGIHCNVIIGLIHNSIVVRLIHGTRIT